MNAWHKTLLIIGGFAITTPALAAPVGAIGGDPKDNESVLFKVKTGGTIVDELLNGVALNATADDRTLDFPLGHKFRSLVVEVDLTHTACTTITVTMTASLTGDTYGNITSRSIASGAATLSTLADTTEAVSGDVTYLITYGVSAYNNLRLLFGGASCGASDTVIVRAVGVP